MSIWSGLVWLKHQLSTTISENTKWKYSNYNKTGTSKYLFKTSDTEFQPMGALDDTTITMKGFSNIDDNFIYVLGSFIPKVSGWHDISFAWQRGSAYPAQLAIGSLQDFYLAEIPELMSQSSISNGPLDVGDAISNMLQGNIQSAIISECPNVVLQRMPHVTLDSFTGTYAHLYCNLVKNVPVYYWAVNTKTSNLTEFQIYNVSCRYYENEALY